MYGALSQLLYLWDLEKQRGGNAGLKSLYVGKKSQRRDNTFYGRDLTPLGTMHLSKFLVV